MMSLINGKAHGMIVINNACWVENNKGEIFTANYCK